jgi:hypothetical protein
MISSIGISLRVPEILELLGVYTQNGWDIENRMDFENIL